jgi:hypothetical protein
VHLRRALLLFAIVLGLAAIAASVSRPGDSADRTATSRTAPGATEPPAAVPGTDVPPPVEVTFPAGDRSTQRIEAGQAATVLVEVEEAGQVDISGLGMSATAEPLTPARFEVLTSATGRYPITFEPAGGDAQSRAGTLVVARPAQ